MEVSEILSSQPILQVENSIQNSKELIIVKGDSFQVYSVDSKGVQIKCEFPTEVPLSVAIVGPKKPSGGSDIVCGVDLSNTWYLFSRVSTSLWAVMKKKKLGDSSSAPVYTKCTTYSLSTHDHLQVFYGEGKGDGCAVVIVNVIFDKFGGVSVYPAEFSLRGYRNVLSIQIVYLSKFQKLMLCVAHFSPVDLVDVMESGVESEEEDKRLRLDFLLMERRTKWRIGEKLYTSKINVDRSEISRFRIICKTKDHTILFNVHSNRYMELSIDGTVTRDEKFDFSKLVEAKGGCLEEAKVCVNETVAHSELRHVVLFHTDRKALTVVDVQSRKTGSFRLENSMLLEIPSFVYYFRTRNSFVMTFSDSSIEFYVLTGSNSLRMVLRVEGGQLGRVLELCSGGLNDRDVYISGSGLLKFGRFAEDGRYRLELGKLPSSSAAKCGIVAMNALYVLTSSSVFKFVDEVVVAMKVYSNEHEQKEKGGGVEFEKMVFVSTLNVFAVFATLAKRVSVIYFIQPVVSNKQQSKEEQEEVHHVLQFVDFVVLGNGQVSPATICTEGSFILCIFANELVIASLAHNEQNCGIIMSVIHKVRIQVPVPVIRSKGQLLSSSSSGSIYTTVLPVGMSLGRQRSSSSSSGEDGRRRRIVIAVATLSHSLVVYSFDVETSELSLHAIANPKDLKMGRVKECRCVLFVSSTSSISLLLLLADSLANVHLIELSETRSVKGGDVEIGLGEGGGGGEETITHKFKFLSKMKVELPSIEDPLVDSGEVGGLVLPGKGSGDDFFGMRIVKSIKMESVVCAMEVIDDVTVRYVCVDGSIGNLNLSSNVES